MNSISVEDTRRLERRDPGSAEISPLPHAAASKADYQECRLYTRNFAKTFFFASHVLPREKRMAAYALYAFCRFTDEIADSAEGVADRDRAERELAAWRACLSSVYFGLDLQDPMLRAFQATVSRYRIPQDYFVDMIRGVEMDLRRNRYADFGEVESYCYCVASTVGLMMTKVFSPADDENALPHAVGLGKAMQLTNILRDVGEDYRRGRIYLPAEDLARFGVSEEDLGKSAPTPEFVRLMKFQIDRARKFYASASAGIPMLPDDGSRLCAKLMSHTYAGILDAIEANGCNTLSRRAFVPSFVKLKIAAGTILR